jgi:hypothetical protein
MLDDIRSTPGGSQPVTEILAGMAKSPRERVLKQWNWKAALLSSLMRGSIFFSVNLFASLGAALSALGTELAFRPVMSGFYAGMTESFRSTEPSWAGTLIVILILPAINHIVELSIHWMRGTQKLGASIIVSVSFSVLSGLFNIFAMRRNVLIIGEGRRSLLDDLRRVPRVLLAFLATPPLAAWQFIVARRSKMRKAQARAELEVQSAPES